MDIFSYVGSIISKKKLEEVGVTLRDYFIWYDDTEHSFRLRKAGKIICVPAIKIHHDQQDVPEGECINWKAYYGMRNRFDLYKRHFPKSVYICKISLGMLKGCIKEGTEKLPLFIAGVFFPLYINSFYT